MTGLGAILAEATPLADGFACTVPVSWHQGRTAYGGFSSALALAAAQQVGGEGLPPLRSVQIGFVGPLSGKVEVRARVLRRGRNATWMAADITSEAGLGLSATLVFMGSVASEISLNTSPPPAGLIPVGEAKPIVTHQFTPAFLLNHMEVRFALPKGDAKRPELCWWLRLQESAGLDPMVALMLIADGLPPGVLPLMTPRTVVSSMGWLVNLLTPAPVTQDGWWLLRSAADFAQGGCSSQQMQIWNSDGVPVVSGMQSIAVFG